MKVTEDHKMKITRKKLQEIISEEVQKFVDNLQNEILQEGRVSPEELKSLLESLEQQNGEDR
jgi:tRNA(Phe) wybutosine-synthesizing methylase Tyw3